MRGDRPPRLEAGMDYRKWRLESDMWQNGTGVAKPKRAPVAIMQILQVTARDFAMRLKKDELMKDAGMDYLLKELDAHFEVDTTQSVFLAIEEIEQFTRNESMDVSTYI